MKHGEIKRREVDVPGPVLAWADRFQQISNGDEELQAHGRHYTCSFLLDLGERRVLLRMNRGHVDDVIIDPGPLDERYQFSISASPETWLKFAQPNPPPMCHGIWAATFREDMKLEGDILVLMQNLREVTRHLELLRQTGVPLGLQQQQQQQQQQQRSTRKPQQAQGARP